MAGLVNRAYKKHMEGVGSPAPEREQTKLYGPGSGPAKHSLPTPMAQLPNTVLKPFFHKGNRAPIPAPAPTPTNSNASSAATATTTTAKQQLAATKATTKQNEAPKQQEASKKSLPLHLRAQGAWEQQSRTAVEELQDLMDIDTPVSELEGEEGGDSGSDTTDLDASPTVRGSEGVGMKGPASPAISLASMDDYIGSSFAKDRFKGNAKQYHPSATKKEQPMEKAPSAHNKETIMIDGSPTPPAGSSSASTQKPRQKQFAGSIISLDDDRNSDIISIGSSGSTSTMPLKEKAVYVPKVFVPKINTTFTPAGVPFNELSFDKEDTESEYVPTDSNSASSTDGGEDDMQKNILDTLQMMRLMHGCTIDIIEEMKKNMRKLDHHAVKTAAALTEVTKNNIVIANTLLEISIGNSQIPAELIEITKACGLIAENLKIIGGADGNTVIASKGAGTKVANGGVGSVLGGGSTGLVGGGNAGNNITPKDLEHLSNQLHTRIDKFISQMNTTQANAEDHLTMLTKRVHDLQATAGIIDDAPRNTKYKEDLEELTATVMTLSDRISHIEDKLGMRPRRNF